MDRVGGGRSRKLREAVKDREEEKREKEKMRGRQERNSRDTR